MSAEANATIVFPCGLQWNYDPTEIDDWDQDAQADAHENGCRECQYWIGLSVNEGRAKFQTIFALASILSANTLNVTAEIEPEAGLPVSGDWLVRFTRGPESAVPA